MGYAWQPTSMTRIDINSLMERVVAYDNKTAADPAAAAAALDEYGLLRATTITRMPAAVAVHSLFTS